MKYLSVYFLAISLLLIGRANSQVITSVDPDTGTQCENLYITVSGEDLNFVQGSSSVWLEDGESGQSIQPIVSTVLNDNQIRGHFYFNPEHDTGFYDVFVYSLNTGTTMSENAFELCAVDSLPEIVSYTPDTAVIGSNQEFYITGKHTHFDANGANNIVKLYSNEHGYIYAYTALDDDSVHLVADFHFNYGCQPGIYDLIVYNRLDGTMTIENAIELQQNGDGPHLTSIEPDSSSLGQELSVTVTATNFNFNQGSYTSQIKLYDDNLGTIYASNEYVVNDTVLGGIFSFSFDYNPGIYDVVVHHQYGDLVMEDGFVLSDCSDCPEITSIDPNSSKLGEEISVAVSATNINFNQGSTTAQIMLYKEGLGTINATNENVINDTVLAGNFSFSLDHNIGIYDVVVEYYENGFMILEDGFDLQNCDICPNLVSIDPETAHQGEQLQVTVTAENVTFTQGSSSTSLFLKNGQSANIYATGEIAMNDSVVTGYFDFSFENDLGFYDVVINNGEYQNLTLENGFELFYAQGPPAVTSVVPGNLSLGTIANLQINAENTEFDYEGNEISATLKHWTETLQSTKIEVIDSVTLMAQFVFSYGHETGWRDLRLYTSHDGVLYRSGAFRLWDSLKSPEISTVLPDTARQKDTLIVRVTGENVAFMQGTSNLMLKNNTISLSPINQTFDSDFGYIEGEFIFSEFLPTGKYDVVVEGDNNWPDAVLEDGFTLKLFDFIGETESHTLLTVYPNPSNGLLNVKRNFKDKGLFLLQVYDINGRFILEDRIEIDENEKQFNLRSFPKGIYFLKIQFGDNEQTEQFLIK